MNKKAIVTLIIGERYKNAWEQYCLPNWEVYAKNHQLDIIAIDSPIDPNDQRSPAWQKCLILEYEKVQQYEQIVWIDSDIIINPKAPSIFSGVPLEKVGAVEGFEQLYKDGEFPKEMLDYLKTPYKNAKGWYSLNHLKTHDKVVQTGVLVLSPNHHKELLRKVYDSPTDSKTGDYEMPLLSHEILNNQLIQWLDKGFNLLWSAQMVFQYPQCLPPKQKDFFFIRQWKKYIRGHYQFPPKNILNSSLKEAVDKSYFLHFAGNAHFMGFAAKFCKDTL